VLVDKGEARPQPLAENILRSLVQCRVKQWAKTSLVHLAGEEVQPSLKSRPLDRAQERALASLICSSPDSIEAFIDFCMAEAAALLRPCEHIVRALTKELLCRRTMTGDEVDEVIVAAVAEKAAADERQRRSDWAQRCANAATFQPGSYVPKTS
jgi:hypothetical protein